MSSIPMRGARTAIAVAVAAGITVAAGLDGPPAAEAAPSVWAKVRNPDLPRRSELLAQVDSLLYKVRQMEMADRPMGMVPVYLHEARRLLEEGGAAQSGDLELRFRLADVYESLRETGKAAAILESIIRSNPPAPLLADAWQSLAVCYARLGRHDEEIKAYGEALARQPHRSSRAVLFGNRAEAYMALGRLPEAIDGYQQALSAASGSPIEMIYHGVTTLWGLAVAMDRNGDLEAALQAITLARTYDPRDIRIRSSDWFFVPPYDDAWYAALGHWVTARRTDLDAVRMDAYDKAISSWVEYIERAPATDKWIAIAKARLLACQKEQNLAMKKAARKPAASPHASQASEDMTESDDSTDATATKRARRKPAPRK